MGNSVNILILGDICPAEGTRSLFDSGDEKAIFGTLLPLLQTADVTVGNLECALSLAALDAVKTGPILRAKPTDAQVLSRAGFDILGIANNHIQDCGSDGVLETVEALRNASVAPVGGGASPDEAAAPRVIENNGLKIGIIAVAEREFNAVSDTCAGAHIFDPLTDLERIRDCALECDFTVVLYHGGIEDYAFPSPELANTCRALIRNGANLVLCQHSHVIGTLEHYQGGQILYGQGNAVYGHRPHNDQWNEGLAVSITISKTKKSAKASCEVQLLPIGSDTHGKVDLLPPNRAELVLTQLNQRSQLAADPAVIEQKWVQFCATLGNQNLPHAFGLGLWATRINKLLKGLLVKLLYTRKQKMIAMNVIRCAAHREVILTSLEQASKPAQASDG